jgi:hypothetical protein
MSTEWMKLRSRSALQADLFEAKRHLGVAKIE